MERRFRVQSSKGKKSCRKVIQYIAIAFFIFLSLQVSAQEKLRIIPIAEDLYVYTTWELYGDKPYPSNSMYLVTSEGVILFDTPWDSTQYQPLLDSIQKKHNSKVIMCIATHYHDDRTGGFSYYRKKGIKTCSSKLTAQLCRENNKEEAEFRFTSDSSMYYFDEKPFLVYYPGEGHTKDNIVIWFDKQKVLYGGCLVKSTEAPDLGNIADANLSKYPVTIKRLMKMFPNRSIVIPGHLGWSDKGSLEHTLKLLEQ